MKFNITLPYIAQKFNEFNALYFDGKLKQCTFSLMRTKSTLGVYRIAKNEISISTYFDRSEEDYCNTIIHEMIHAYIRQNHIKDTNKHHGKVFYAWADKINQYGWHIARTDSVEGCGLTKKNNKEWIVAIFNSNNTGKYFMFCINKNYYREYMLRFKAYSYWYKDVIVFTSTDDKMYGSYTECRKSVRGQYVSKDVYDAIKSNVINLMAA